MDKVDTRKENKEVNEKLLSGIMKRTKIKEGELKELLLVLKLRIDTKKATRFLVRIRQHSGDVLRDALFQYKSYRKHIPPNCNGRIKQFFRFLLNSSKTVDSYGDINFKKKELNDELNEDLINAIDGEDSMDLEGVINE